MITQKFFPGVVQYVFSDMDVNVFYIEKTKTLIDTGTKPLQNEFCKYIRDMDVENVVLTHVHFDHIGGIDLFKDYPVFMSRGSMEIFESGDDTYMLFSQVGDIPPESTGHNLKGVDEFLSLKVFHTPGHLVGSICLYDEVQKYLFSGDLIFDVGVTGRVDLKGASRADLIKSLQNLKDIEVNVLFPGHGDVVFEKDVISQTLDLMS